MERNEPEHILVKLEKETYTVREDISAINCYIKELQTTLIKKLVIPATVKTITDTSEVADFETFEASEYNPYFSTRDGVLYTKDFKTLLAYPRSKPDKEFIVPPEVETIADEAFCRNLLLENIVIPPSVKTLGNRAFYSCKRLTNITLSEGLKQIGHDCFSNSRKVTILTIPSSITKLYTSILTAGLCVAVPDSVQSLDYDDSDHFSSGTIILVHNNPVVTAFATSGACSFVANYSIDDNGNIWSPDGVLIRFSNRCNSKTYTLPTHTTGILANAFVNSSVKTITCKYGQKAEWISSLGKSTLALQMADQMAANNIPVVYMSLEMSREDITAKLVSMHTFTDVGGRFAKTATELTGSQLDKFSDADWAAVGEAVSALTSHRANITICDACVHGMSVDDISNYMQEYTKAYDVAPVLIIDYLQILKASEGMERYTDKQAVDHNVAEFRTLAATYNVPVIVISSFNRESYNSQVSLKSYKDNGNIEYSSDTLIGL